MRKVAVTGNMGSGKTTVCKVFETLGIPVFYADPEARKFLDNPVVMEEIFQVFGGRVWNSRQQTIDRKVLASEVFADPEKLQQLNNIIHPRVHKAFDGWLMRQHAPYCIQESALVFETGSYRKFDKTILVWSDEETMIRRVMERDQSSRQQVQERLAHQQSQQQKARMADYILRNVDNELLIPQILSLHKELLQITESTA